MEYELHAHGQESRAWTDVPFAEYLKEVIYGGVDGIITTFAVVAGFAGAALPNESAAGLSFLLVLLFGLANLCADGVSMGLSNFLSVRSDQARYRNVRREAESALRTDAAAAYASTEELMLEKGFSPEDASALVAIYRKNESFWTDIIMNHERSMPDVRDENPVYTGLATFFAFLIFGSIPLAPFVLFEASTPDAVFGFSILGTALALLLLGLLKWKVIKSDLLKSVLEMLVVGGIAAAVAFFVGTFFSV